MRKKIKEMKLRGEAVYHGIHTFDENNKPDEFALGSKVIGANIELYEKIELQDRIKMKYLNVLIFCVLRQPEIMSLLCGWRDCYYVSDIKIMKTPTRYNGKFEFESLKDSEIFEDIIELLDDRDIQTFKQ